MASKYDDKLGRIMADWDDGQGSDGMTLRELIAEWANVDVECVEIDAEGDVYDGRHWLGTEDRGRLADWLRARCRIDD